MANAPQPIKTPLTEPFYAAAAEGRLLIQRCRATGRHQWYPRAHSVHDIRADVDWEEASGRGEVYTFSVVNRSPFDDVEAPFVFAIVELEEGVRMATNIVGIDPDQVRIGMPVRVRFEQRGETALPVFEAA
jgi:uncharacterized OB-fold protein